MIRVPAYLQLSQYGIYHFRIAIPVSLRVSLGRTEINKSLRTSNRREAIQMARQLYLQIEELFQEAQLMAKNNGKYPDTGIIILQGLKSDKVAIDNIKIESDTPEEEKDIAQAIISALNGSKAGLRETIKAAEEQLVTLSELIEKYSEEKVKEGAWVGATREENAGIFKRFAEILGDMTVSNIGFEQARYYKKILMQLPPHLNKKKQFEGMTIKQVIKLKLPETISNRTINKNLGAVSGLFNWAKRNGYVAENFFAGFGLRGKNQKPHEERSIFTAGDLNKLFSTAIYTEKKALYSYMFWVPLIGLYTGARLEEICQLYLEDVRQVDGVWVFDIKEEGDRSVKNPQSNRCVPVHSELIRLGILKYAAALSKQGHKRMFPELKMDKYGKRSPRVSKWFNERYRRKCGVTAHGKVFYSFRHTVINQLSTASEKI